MIKTAILGFGNVGKGVASVLDTNREEIARRIPGGLELGYILDIRDFPESPFADKVTHDYEEILGDPDVKVICETMGGKEPAYTFPGELWRRGSVSVPPIKSWWKPGAESFLKLPGSTTAVICSRPA